MDVSSWPPLILAGFLVGFVAVSIWRLRPFSNKAAAAGLDLFSRWLLAGFFLIPLLLAAACIGYVEENWRGAHAWTHAQGELRRRGESLDWKEFIPPPVPEDQNLALAALFRRELGYTRDPATGFLTIPGSPPYRRGVLLGMPDGDRQRPNEGLPGWAPPSFGPTNLAPVAKTFRDSRVFHHLPQPGTPAQDILCGLTRYGPALDELAQAAAERPLARFPVGWENDDLLSLSTDYPFFLWRLASTLRLRASALLADGQPAAALRDIRLGLRLNRALTFDPTAIGFRWERMGLAMTLNAVWQGLAERRWSGAQLAELQDDLCRFDLLADVMHATRGERARELTGIEYAVQHRPAWPRGPKPGISAFGSRDGYLRFAPPGWIDQSKALLCRLVQRQVLDAVDLPNRRLRSAALPPFPGGTPFDPQTAAGLYGPALGDLPPLNFLIFQTARVQTALDHAVVACALERFYLDRHAYPAKLDELVPAYLARLPTDLVDGAPLRYGPTADARYRLYGVGWKGWDDGGKVVLNPASRSVDDAKSDWVWQYEPVSSSGGPGGK